ncbi:MAG TPA: hypothetical protein VNT28_08510 [Candidatus Limnocylindrales bacterium]|jgi:hypothetical protein|nr:hypothetical protein [Candidatus Limnocylindrales bacterium]
MSVLLPAITALLAFVFAVALLDQWRERRRGFQLIWALGMLFFGIGAGAEAVGAAIGWSEALYRTWYLTGAVFTAAWLGLGTAFLLAKTRFGYTYGALIVLGGLIAFFARRAYPEAGDFATLLFIGALVFGLAVALETYFQNERWPLIAAIGVIAASAVATYVAFAMPLSGPVAIDSHTGVPTGAAIAAPERLISLVMNISGGLALVLGALFSAYVFMPKKRVLDYSLDPGQPGDEFLFNLAIAVIAIPVNFVLSLPGTLRALVSGRIHSRVPATMLIAIGGLAAGAGDLLSRLGSTELFQLGKFLAVTLIFLGFLVSIEAFREIRIPFTRVVLRGARRERAEAAGSGRGA